MPGGTPGVVGGATTHGQSKNGRTHLYRAWLSMRRRCRDRPEYRDRGVKVCAAWESSFAAFAADMEEPPSPKHTLDRYPNCVGDYEPGNVRWATTLEQRHNRRPDSKVGRPWLGKKRQLRHGIGGKFLRNMEA